MRNLEAAISSEAFSQAMEEWMRSLGSDLNALFGKKTIVQVQSATEAQDVSVTGTAYQDLLVVPITTTRPAASLILRATMSAEIAGGGVPGSPSYGSIFALMPGDNAATIAQGAPVLFPQDGPLVGGVVRSGNAGLVLPTVGDYRVTAQVSVTEPGQLVVAYQAGGVGLFAELASTVVGRATGTDQIILDTIIHSATPNSVIQLWNPTGNAAALTITPIAGGTHSVSATFNAELLAQGPAVPGPSALFELTLDGGPALPVGAAITASPSSAALSFVVGNVAPGAHTVRLRWAGSAAGVTANINAASTPLRDHATLTVEEFG